MSTDGPQDDSKPAFADYGFEMSPDWSNAGGSGSETISRPASPADSTEQTQQGVREQSTAEIAQPDTTAGAKEVGDVPAESQPSPAAAVDLSREVMTRLKAEGRWFGELEFVRDDMMRLGRKRFKDKSERQQWVYGELDRLYPPLKTPQLERNSTVEAVNKRETIVSENSPIGEKITPDDGSIQGLGTLPKGWPELPANASLATEIGWVQANRLRVVTEVPGKATRVDLSRALSPAPSWAALGWLETSIRSYAKFVDVAARASGADDGDAGLVRRERMAIEEIKALLAEMDASE